MSFINLIFKIIRKLILVIVFIFGIQTTGFCQAINTDDLIGYWKPDVESAQVFFWKDGNGKLQFQEISGSTGEPIDTISLRIKEDTVIAKTIFIPNHWVTENRFTFKDKNTLVCQTTLDGEGTITYTKIK